MQAHHQFFQSQLSVEPTSSSYQGSNTSFSCRSSSILRGKNLLKIGGSGASRKVSRPRYLTPDPVPSSSQSTATGSMRTSMTGADYATPELHTPLSELNIQTDNFYTPQSSNEPFIWTQSWDNFNFTDQRAYDQQFFSPSEASLDTLSDDFLADDDIGDYFQGDRPDPQVFPTQCNTVFDPSLNLEQSIDILQGLITSKRLNDEFQSIELLRTDFTVFCSLLRDNVLKNRYNDILPYDRTRVILTNERLGDYINANHLTMVLPDLSNLKYIASQGPLVETVETFWEMILEQECSVVVMLTGIYENTVMKCYPYWPDVGQPIDFQDFLIYVEAPPIEESNVSTREVLIQDKRRQQQVRQVNILQYTQWPDKGCPLNSNDFLNFVDRVRSYRKTYLEPYGSPLLVHCSAGIGRTGVLIIMETACRLIESGMPVSPLDLVGVLREQRPYMIQTPEQFSFVCQAIVKFYKQRRKSLPTAGSSSSVATSSSLMASAGIS